MTEAEAQRLVAVLATAFPNAMGRMSPEQQADTMRVYRSMLRDLDYVVANAAVERLLATSRFMPTVAEIRDTAFVLTSGDVAAGGEGWRDVLEAVSRFGAYRVPGTDFQFADPIVADCVACLGWRNLCLSENQPADRARFIELYDIKAQQARRFALTEGLLAMQRLREVQRDEMAIGAGQAVARVLRLLPGGDK